MSWFYCRWERGSRYYEARIQQDLWGEWLLVQAWGRQGTALGQQRNIPCENYPATLARFQRLQRQRLRRGYCEVARTPLDVS